MIIPIKNFDILNKLSPLIDKIKFLPYDKEEYLKRISRNMNNDDALLVVDIDDSNEVRSFAFIEAGLVYGRKEALMVIAYTNAKDQDIGIEMWDMVLKWIKLRECTRISAYVKDKRENAFIKKYGFNNRFAYITKEIHNEWRCP